MHNYKLTASVYLGSLHGDGEDEEAFMECLMSQQLPQSGQLPAILKLRHVGDAVSEWSAPVMLLPGSHAAGKIMQSLC